MTAPPEVRRCPKCAMPALILVNEWHHTQGSISTGMTTQEYRCQECGAWEVQSSNRKIFLWTMGVMLTLGTCVGGLPFIFLALRHQRFDQRAPVVPGAPVPAVRFPSGPPKRTCGACGGVAHAVKITRNTHRGIPTGDDYEYRCSACQKEFTTESPLAMVSATFAGLASIGIGAGFFFGADHPGWKWGGTALFGGGGVLILLQWAQRLRNRFTNPPLPVERTTGLPPSGV